MRKEFLIERQGKVYVLYAGLLEEAHAQGLKRIETELLQIPTPENGHIAICKATVQTEKGIFTGLGDASPENVSKLMSLHLIRMAETRAKARALRDAVNVGVAALEEFVEDEPEVSSSSSPQDSTLEYPHKQAAVKKQPPENLEVIRFREQIESAKDFVELNSLWDEARKSLPQWSLPSIQKVYLQRGRELRVGRE